MGTTLTGTTPQDTYDSLIKVTDNGPLSGTAKYLSDGLGNDSVLALSTTLVGVNTNTPSNFLQVTDPNSAVGGAQLTLEGRATGYGAGVVFSSRVDNASGALVPMAKITGDGEDAWTSTAATQDAGMRFSTATDGSLTEKMRITSAGNVGIGTDAPTGKLTISQANSGGVAAILLTEDESTIQGPSANTYLKMGGNMTLGAAGVIPIQIATTEVLRVTANGLTFNGDTAAANALDDYEEGTFTPTMAFDGASVGITYLTQAGKYTKVGNKVSFSAVLTLSNKGSSTGNVSIAGLPYNISPATNADFIPITIGAFINITFNTVPACVGIVNTNTVIFDEYISGGAQTALTNADFANDSTIRIAGFYFV